MKDLLPSYLSFQSRNYLVFVFYLLASETSGILSYKIYFLVLQLAQVVGLALLVFVAERDDT